MAESGFKSSSAWLPTPYHTLKGTNVKDDESLMKASNSMGHYRASSQTPCRPVLPVASLRVDTSVYEEVTGRYPGDIY